MSFWDHSDFVPDSPTTPAIPISIKPYRRDGVGDAATPSVRPGGSVDTDGDGIGNNADPTTTTTAERWHDRRRTDPLDSTGCDGALAPRSAARPLNAASTPEVCDADNDLNDGVDEGFGH
jgi:hypothetical protein